MTIEKEANKLDSLPFIILGSGKFKSFKVLCLYCYKDIKYFHVGYTSIYKKSPDYDFFGESIEEACEKCKEFLLKIPERLKIYEFDGLLD